MAELLGVWSLVLLVIPFLAWPTTTAANEGRSFSVTQLSRADRSQPLDISTHFARNLIRYGGEIPPRSVVSAETATVFASTQNGEFIVPVSVGAAMLNLSIDTGSSDL
jgi:hypothetical protein